MRKVSPMKAVNNRFISNLLLIMNKDIIKYIESEGYAKVRPVRIVGGEKPECEHCGKRIKRCNMRQHQRTDRCIRAQKAKPA